MRTVPRFDSYSVREYGEAVAVFRLAADGPFYSEIAGKRKVIRKPNGKKIWNVRDARQWARDKHRELLRGEPEHPTLAAIFDTYLEHRSPVKATAQGRKDDKRRAEMWKAFLGATRDPATITRGDLDLFIQKRGYRVIDAWGVAVGVCRISPATGNKARGHTAALSKRPAAAPLVGVPTVRPRTVQADIQWLSTVLRRKLTDHCNVPSLRDIARDLHQSADPRQPIATQDRLEATLKHADGYLQELLLLVNATGHRLSAVLSLKWSDIDWTVEPERRPYGSIRWRADAVGNKVRNEHVVQMSRRTRAVLRLIRRRRPGIGGAWIFPAPRSKPSNPKPLHRSVADKWLRQAEKRAKLEPQDGSLWHAYRRKWATERKGHSMVDVAKAGGWKSARTVPTYQLPDDVNVLRVVLDATELREEKA